MVNALHRLAVLALGLVFLVSAVLKSLDASAMTSQIVYLGVTRAQWLAHLIAVGIIGVEAMVGVALLLGLWLKPVVLPATGVMLVFFSGVMGWAWAFRDIHDCGCFGKYLPLTPAETLIKNLVLLSLAIYAWGGMSRKSGAEWRRGGRNLAWRLGVATLGVVATVGMAAVQGPKPGRAETPADAGAPLAGYTLTWQGGRVTYDLSRGTYLVALLSESCSHCAEEVAGLNRLTTDNHLPPVVALVLGDDEAVQAFGERYRPNFPMRALPIMDFLKLIGDAPPRYVLTRDGRQLAFWDDKIPTPMEILLTLERLRPKASR